jgi:AcrR family transcriptional regulator
MQSLFQRSLTQTNSGEEDTRSRILQAALRLFAAKGYEGTTTKDLAGKANVAEGTLFRYFPNRSGH